ncbi:hypothetical protein B0J11DRAFT_214029 [Dendryphion nanum]|uniref:SWIM-type domain-containing protein n=1 Tax=Dendryphion nanum TaxID=256645 RepID=A0A9P9E769_9PLEO|nr:hypothetical protein B0J11DRAFT_214029 [Dendryphion nanum]
MSAEELSRLSLGDSMVTTRAGAARARTAPPIQTSQSASSSQTNSPTPSLIEASSGLKYNVTAFDTEVRRRAKRGLMDDNAIEIKYCKVADHDDKQYMFFIEDEITVAMGGKYSVPRCTCGANEDGIACKHIFYMLDQLAQGVPDNIKSQALELSIDGSSVQSIQPSDIIDKISLAKVAKGLHWVRFDDPIPDDEDIEDEIAEMLSVFEPSDALPSEFKSPESPFPSERARRFREFKNIFTQFATQNLGLYGRLQELIDPVFQTQVFFDKINDRVTRAFKALDEYISNGPTDARFESYDVVTCATKLKGLVNAIDDYYHQQVENGHEAKEVAIRAATTLINILDEVTNRNCDAYANITWDGIPPTDAKQNNLFVCLIESPGEEDGNFVLDALKNLPQEFVLRRHWEVLSNIGDKLAPQWTPTEYLNVFRALTTESRKRAASEVSGSTSKRAAP